MEIYPEKGQYLPGEPIELTILYDGNADRFRVSVFLLESCLYILEVPRTGTQTRVKLKPVYAEFCGLGILCETECGERACCAADVQGETRAFRYGFLSDFAPEEADEADVLAMAKHHVNAVQFYDWSFRHDTLVSETKEYADMMGKRNSLFVVRRKIEACHKRGMRALGYGAVYAASEAFAAQHEDWRLYARANEPLRFIDVFAIMNLESGWREHIISQYCAAANAGFDGVHMDTYGFPKTAIDSTGSIVHLEDDFAPLIERTRAALPEATLVFNNVGGWPVERTMDSPVDAVYIEVWPPFERYEHIKQLILSAKAAKKPVVLAAYPAPFRLDTPERALEAQLVLMSAIAAHGATQLWFGEENAALTQGYYADYARLSAEQEHLLRTYDDFIVRYEDLLFDDTLQDVSMTHCGWDNEEYACSAPYSVCGEGGKLWLILREQGKRKLITLINLTGDDSSLWNAGRNAPEPICDITLKVQAFSPVARAWTASPDCNSGAAEPVAVVREQGMRGDVLTICLPKLERFAILYLETEE
ncbi:MAG TPA: glycoside hydrolase family 66 protein [Candidatus Cryosericum sp.]|nr:glycoside hydrolase family 66 protein [Candidatus Cryosericum sp.]